MPEPFRSESSDPVAALAQLQEAGLLDGAAEEAFDRFTRLTSVFLDVPVAQLNLITPDRQITKSCAGPEPWASIRAVPLTHSFCKHVLELPQLVIEDAREHPLVRDNGATTESGVVAYAGMPVRTPDGAAIGSLCAVDFVPRQWTPAELDALRDLAGGVGAEVALRLEVGERRRTEARLRESDARFRASFDHAAIGMALVGLDGRWLGVNESLCRTVGYTREELLDRTSQDIAHRDELEADGAAMERLLAGDIQSYEMQKRYLHKAGHEIWLLLTWSVVPAADGTPLHFIGQVQEITERKEAKRRLEDLNQELERRVAARTAELESAHAEVRERVTELTEAEQRLRHSEQRYRSLFEHNPHGVYLIDHSGGLVAVNRAVEGLLGVAPEEVIGQPFARFLAPEELERGWDVFARVFAGEPQVFETVLLRPDGRSVEIRTINVPIVVDGRIEGLIGVAEDVTERKSLESQLRQSQKMEAIGRLAGGVAHDFNNIITAIRGYAQLLLDEVLKEPDPARQDVEEIARAADRASGLTRQLLAFSRKQVLRPEVIDLNEVVTGLEKMLRRVIGDHIELRTSLPAEPSPIVADPGQLEQVLMNLVVNARDAMPDGGVITLGSTRVELQGEDLRGAPGLEPGPYVRLSVSDNGTGMPAHVRDRIFEPFFTTKEQGKGTGLGLSTVYGITRQSGGFIEVESEVGQGATFRVYLPAADAAPRRRQTAEPAAEPGTGAEVILLVEDEPAVRALARRVLHRSGYTVIEAASGAEALNACQQHEGPIHVMVSDVSMPQMSGIELARRVRDLRPEMRILLMSGYSEADLGSGAALDADVLFLEKPFTPATLTRRVREACTAGR